MTAKEANQMVIDKVAIVRQTADSDIEDFAIRQSQDIELGPITNLRLSEEERPSAEILSRESEVTKKLALKWG